VNINLTLIGQSIAFVIFVWFCMRYIWPPITEALEARKKKIADGLAAAEKGEQALREAEEFFQSKADEAKQNASEIINKAEKRSDEVVDEAKAVAREEGEKIKQAANAEIEQEVNRAREKLRKEVSAIALAGVERILEKEIDEKVHKKALDELAKQI